MALPDFEIVRVVARCDFQRAGAEFHRHVGVVDHGNRPLEHRHQTGRADQMPVALVVGVYSHGGVAQDRLRPSSRHRDETHPGAIVQVGARDRVLEVVERGVFFPVLHLQIADRGLQAGRPVDQVLAAVDQPHAVEPHKRLAHRAAEPLVQGEAHAIPIARPAQAAELAHDVATVLILPGPSAAEELLAADVLAADALLREHLLHLELRGDAGVIVPGHPQRRVTAHALVADHQILQRDEHGVTQVQLAGDVGRRDRDHERLGVRPGDLRFEEAGLLPPFINPPLGRGRIVGFGHIECRHGCFLLYFHTLGVPAYCVLRADGYAVMREPMANRRINQCVNDC